VFRTVWRLALVLSIPAALETRAAIPPSDLAIALEPVAEGLVAPVCAVSAGDGSGRLFVADQVGQIRIVGPGGLVDRPFLDLADRVVVVNRGYDERGLLGLAFHPRYRENGRFFVRYSAPRPGSPGEPCFGTGRGCHDEVLSEFRVSADPGVADASSERVLLQVTKPQFNHNSGDVAFGPDGYLYVGLGDGGGANDGLADIPPSHGPIGNGQNIDVLLGKILRLDVDAPAGALPYAIPPDNPFVGKDGRDEIYAYGFRNPYRFSFNGGGLLIVADVGQNRFEEVDVVQKGGNYGWVTREGFSCFDPFNPLDPPATCPDRGLRGDRLLDPVAAYDHTEGIAVVGGFVYAGGGVPALRGKYVFGDFSRGFFPAEGRLFVLDLDASRVRPAASRAPGGIVVAPGLSLPVLELRIDGAPALAGRYLKGLGRDDAGEIYVLASSSLGPGGSGGTIYRLVAAP
jgi:glucose/arabinose dehydrogenase